jgi:histidinol phosphatase-like PHP family hydrolase
MSKIVDKHFHYDPMFTTQNYGEAIKNLDKETAFFVIHEYQRDWVGALKDTAFQLNLRCGMEFTIGPYTTLDKIKKAYDETQFPMIYSIHSYKSQQNFLEVFKLNVEKNKINYIAHPFFDTFPKETVGKDILRDFICICKDNNVTVELNNKYYRPNMVLFIEEIFKNIPKDKISIATDGHSPNKIGVYRKEFIECIKNCKGLDLMYKEQ